MSELRATTVRCPECNAILQVTEGASVATCSYCGTTAQVQRRTQFLQRPKPLPPTSHPQPMPVARQVVRRGPLAAILVIAMLGGAFAIAVPIVVKKVKQAGGPGWNGLGPALVADVDGDGIDDAIGFARYVLDGDRMHLAAYSGKDGSQIWQGERLGTYTEVYQSGLVLAGDTIVRADARAAIEGFDVKTGARRWRATTGDVVDRMCASAPGELSIKTKDGQWLAIAVKDGAMHPSSPPASCGEMQSARSHATRARVIERPDVNVGGMNVGRMYTRGDGPRIAAGHRASGTSVPMLAAVDDKGVVLWRSDVPGTDPLTVSTFDLEDVALDDHDVATTYDRGQRRFLTVFDRTTGARRFEVPVPMGVTIVVGGLSLTRTAVLVSCWGHLEAFDRVGGRQLWRVGQL